MEETGGHEVTTAAEEARRVGFPANPGPVRPSRGKLADGHAGLSSLSNHFVECHSRAEQQG